MIEIGLDGKSSARDSLHQALFAEHLTGKTPVVILIDRDGPKAGSNTKCGTSPMRLA
ncbi:hypothetical protein [Roseovarius aestuariivivens]|uniref:hypothetical protein n=1 Tax=Roseovarius aestuariivivens TaxID=1888910 RepID=UPI001436C34C|nr:hypothetical protein [Roseovarius aestuariivivens]